MALLWIMCGPAEDPQWLISELWLTKTEVVAKNVFSNLAWDSQVSFVAEFSQDRPWLRPATRDLNSPSDSSLPSPSTPAAKILHWRVLEELLHPRSDTAPPLAPTATWPRPKIPHFQFPPLQNLLHLFILPFTCTSVYLSACLFSSLSHALI